MPQSWQEQVKGQVRRRYSQMARHGGFPADGPGRAREAGYAAAWVDSLPPSIADSYCGCGMLYDGASVTGVKRLAELGCGAGFDLRHLFEYLAYAGQAVALDLSRAMLERAAAAVNSQAAGRLVAVAGDMERLPLAAASVDLVTANASFNLSLDKAAAFAEAFRILRAGGRLRARDLVRDGDLPAELAADAAAWNTSLGGVLEEQALHAAVSEAGFQSVRISDHRPFAPVTSVLLEAVKPA